jgi:hypothetical protein
MEPCRDLLMVSGIAVGGPEVRHCEEAAGGIDDGLLQSAPVRSATFALLGCSWP